VKTDRRTSFSRNFKYRSVGRLQILDFGEKKIILTVR